MVQVYINSVEVKVKSGLNIKTELSEKLDVGLLIIPQVEEMAIEPLDQVLITDSDLDPIYVKYFLVSDYVRKVVVWGATKKYDYQINLISPAIKLQRIPLPNRKITQPLIGTKKTLWEVLSNYVELYAPDYTLSGNMYNETYQIECPEMSWNRPTLFEVFNDLLSVIGAVVTITAFTTIDLLFLFSQGNEINLSSNNLSNIEVSQFAEEYASELEMETENAIVDYTNSETMEWVAVKTTQGAIVTTENCEIILDNPIYELSEIRCRVVYYDDPDNVEIDLDITPYVVEKSVYDLMDSSASISVVSGNYKRNRLYYTMGDNVIKGLSYTEDSILPFISTPYAIINILTNANGGTPLPFGNEYVRRLSFRVKYKTNNILKFKSFKETLPKHTSVLIDNPTNSLSNTMLLGMQQQQTINRIGNPVMQINGKVANIGEIPKLADYTGDYILDSLEFSIYSDYVMFEAILSKNSVRKTIFTGINSQKRYTQLIDNNKALVCNHLTVEKLQFSFTNATNEATLENYFLLLGFINQKINLAIIRTSFDGTTWQAKKIGLAGNVFVLPNSLIYAVQMKDNYSAGTYCFTNDNFWQSGELSIGGYGIKETSYVDTNGEFVTLELLLYRNFENELINSIYTDDYNDGLELARNYPEIDSTLVPAITDSIYQLEVNRYKDAGEITAETIQFNFTTDTDDIVIGKQFYIDSPMAITATSAKTLKFIYSTTEFYLKGENIGKGTVLPGGTITVSNNSIGLDISAYETDPFTTLLANIISWGIVDDDNNLYIGVNCMNNVSTRTKVYLNKL